ncbi:DUF927 domain-containing protein [Stagnihabitans tardus]|uniref:DUF927 domain-containing protein n=1 Tax=Stagnihabitans tardus TaxID=2699202 RepID=A0AAE5BUT5_9RHOB|nr:DUF927 domain-containing protein [Stagnihabitans tardus]NBZ87577.1 DUF927 domain-containing protein [Stagnihabitans tardus]
MGQMITLTRDAWREVDPADPSTAVAHADGMPPGLELLPDGLWQTAPDGKTHRIGSWLVIEALFKEAVGQGWGKVVVITDPDGTRHRLTFLDGEIATNWSKVLSTLLNAGYQLGEAPDAGKRLQRVLQAWRPQARRSRIGRIGVHLTPQPCFVLPTGQVIGAEGLVADAAATSAAADMQPAGRIEDWREQIGALCSGNPLMIMAVSLAFFGPVLGLVDPDMGGGFHLGGSSSRGKSTIAEVAASVWGGPRLRRSWNATANGLEALAVAHSGTLLILDEIGEAAPKVIGRAIYALSNGAGKGRMTSEAGLRAGESWALAFLSTGELGVARKLAEAGVDIMAGQAVRLIEVAADGRRFGAFDTLHGARDGAAFADLIKAQRLRFHGTAGPAFVEAAFADVEATRAQIGTLAQNGMVRMRKGLGVEPDGQMLRVLKRCAHVAAAGELATRHGLTGWAAGEAENALVEVFEDWLAARDDGSTLAATLHLQKLRSWLRDHDSEIAELPVVSVSRTKGWKDKERIYLSPEAWVEIHGPSHASVSRVLEGAGVLETGDGRNIAARAPRAIPGRPRVYRLRRACVEGVASPDGTHME